MPFDSIQRETEPEQLNASMETDLLRSKIQIDIRKMKQGSFRDKKMNPKFDNVTVNQKLKL